MQLKKDAPLSSYLIPPVNSTNMVCMRTCEARTVWGFLGVRKLRAVQSVQSIEFVGIGV
jgi:hypothetical protein